jgi:protein gp37
MNKTKIEWCDYTWNPATGCLHGCSYCYAKRNTEEHGGNFNPLFHESRLIQPKGVKKPQNVFVGSMTDLFGNWFSDEQINKVFNACNEAPQHRYLFLTKNPNRYAQLYESGILPEQHWYGITLDHAPDEEDDESEWNIYPPIKHGFVSIEPLTENIVNRHFPIADWYIIGAESGNRKWKVTPKRKWIEAIIEICRENNKPVFLKNNLASIWKQPLIQEYPWKKEESKDEIHSTDKVCIQRNLFS